MGENALLEEAQRIATSSVMKGSSTYSSLLLYLAKASISGNIPKESTIAFDIFGRKNFDPSQSTLIRVYIYHLRKKIDTYYNSIGSNNAQRLLLPKGNYKLFIEKKAPSQGWTKQIRPKHLVIPAVTVFVLSALVWAIPALTRLATGQKDTGLWSDLISTDVPLTVVIGDFYIFNEYHANTNNRRLVRDPEINSKEDYERYMNTAGMGSKTNTLNFTMLPFYSSFWIKDISQTFIPHDRSFSLRTASRFNPVELQDHNIVVVGMLKTIGMFQSYFDNSDYSFVDNYCLVYTDPKSGKETTYTPTGNPSEGHKDYTFISKIPGPGTNKIYLFGGLWDIGADEGLKNFTNPELRKTLEKTMVKTFGYVPEYYEILMEANGYDRMGIDSKIIRINEIQKEKVVWDFKVVQRSP
ncbi:hypothetical protein [Maribacter sp. 2-571]|uniref:hypothetical protein n=1 Tax=Maribacter sp. 2-571 TaxID=3417569 RepID=UPI003D344EDF